ncbi:DNA polymerase III subunit epsilon [Candidatus Phycosocius spiralis]|uniref:DNA polymerase III subunit epsilon n=1 Tax=Candidatus Phycosocius spiralis TaxID=2815099 RepID=A0ABQ4PUI7_9PROT|nr:DNA polymerase III subunit epsilon [Candidatus Phycosocius spiralis]GIU66644.1 DNA polymerase III subunit epsilon [Candidatus Phycosocius spiralis]
MREIVFDTETTGTDPERGDRIVEIGCVELIDLVPTGLTFHRYVNPERDIPAEVVRVHGLTAELLADKPVFGAPEVVDELLDFIGDAPLVAHNAEFDRRFLNGELARLGRPTIAKERCVDTLLIARKKYPGAPASLDALCRRLNIDLSSRDKHGALLDAQLLAAVYLELKGGRERRLNFLDPIEAAKPSQTRQNSPLEAPQPRQTRVRPKPLEPLSTPEEHQAHAAFLLSIGPETVWSRLRVTPD